METQNIISAAQIMFRNSAAAILSDGKILWENELFTSSADELGRERFEEIAVSAVSSDKDTYSAFCGIILVSASVYRFPEYDSSAVSVSVHDYDADGISAVVMYGNRAVYESRAFSALTANGGREKFVNMAIAAKNSHSGISNGIFRGYAYTCSAAVKASDGGVLASYYSDVFFASFPPELRESIHRIAARVRDSSQTITVNADNIYKLLLSKNQMLSEDLKKSLNTIDHSVVMAYSEILIPTELIRYASGEVSGRIEPLGKFCQTFCNSLEKTAEGSERRKLCVSFSCDEDLVGYFRAETLELLLSAMIGKAFEEDPSCKFFKILVKSAVTEKGKVIKINAMAGDKNGMDQDIELFGKINSFPGRDSADLFEALVACFCEEFGCSYSLISYNGLRSLGIVMPVAEEPDCASSEKPTFKKNNRFSVERAMLAGSIFSDRYK